MLKVILTELGIGVFDGDTCMKTITFSQPADDYIFIKKGKSRISELSKFLLNEQNDVIVNDLALHDLLKKKDIESQMMSEHDIEDIQFTKPKILINANLATDENDAMQKLRDFAIQLSSSKITEVSGSPDLHVIQSINTLDDTDKIINGISSRLREWYGLHFPELDNIIDSVNGYAQIVLAGKRENMSDDVFVNAGFPDSKIQMLSVVKGKSRGGDITDENLLMVQALAKNILELFDMRKNLEAQIDTQMEEIAPNITAVLGTTVGARILAKAGSLVKLSKMPASTIQVLGAEKALFRALKTGSNPPKHGLLFQHAVVHAAPRWQRGKIARAIAAKAAIAARVDVHGAGLNKTLLEKLNIRVKEIEEKYEKPVKKPQQGNISNNSNYDRNNNSRQRKKSDRFKNRKRSNFGRRDR
jgi:nucleolar protein 56|tara:strand:- start:3531 stop:4775 length:1245 start_codon:yes stop_codon:yes gene_type:complete